MYTHENNYIISGADPKTARGALIMVHGRGGSAQDMLFFSRNLKTGGLALYLPQANRNSWYPFSFMSPADQNEPALGSALLQIDKLIDEITSAGIPAENIYFLGFSQGACLILEYLAGHARRYAGVVAFTGGLIGAELQTRNYKGDFEDTPFLLTNGDPDPHVPVQRVKESAAILKNMNASLTLKIYPGRSHIISQSELTLANQLLSQ